MAPRKSKVVETPSAPADVKQSEEKAPEAKSKEVKVGKFAGKNFSFFHPFQKVHIPAGGDGVTLELDSWLQCQIDAGFIIKL